MADTLQRIVLLGAGNAGSHLAKAIVSSGHELVQVFSRTIDHAKALAEKYKAGFTKDLSNLADADLYIFCIKDDALAELVSMVKLEGKKIVHTSGALPMDALSNVSQYYGVFYPLQTFTGGLDVDWKRIPICIEASDTKMLAGLKYLAAAISDSVLETSFEDRQKMHVAAVFVNNFTNYLLQNAEEIMKQTSLPFSILQPLAEETIRKAFLLGPADAQTGPAIRGDEKTIAAHEELLSSDPEIREIYRALTEAIKKSQK
jgi:predicted short-subunit dehydrogenase-like oxidoreductase (DUF2520 family)